MGFVAWCCDNPFNIRHTQGGFLISMQKQKNGVAQEGTMELTDSQRWWNEYGFLVTTIANSPLGERLFGLSLTTPKGKQPPYLSEIRSNFYTVSYPPVEVEKPSPHMKTRCISTFFTDDYFTKVINAHWRVFVQLVAEAFRNPTVLARYSTRKDGQIVLPIIPKPPLTKTRCVGGFQLSDTDSPVLEQSSSFKIGGIMREDTTIGLPRLYLKFLLRDLMFRFHKWGKDTPTRLLSGHLTLFFNDTKKGNLPKDFQGFSVVEASSKWDDFNKKLIPLETSETKELKDGFNVFPFRLEQKLTDNDPISNIIEEAKKDVLEVGVMSLTGIALARKGKADKRAGLTMNSGVAYLGTDKNKAPRLTIMYDFLDEITPSFSTSDNSQSAR